METTEQGNNLIANFLGFIPKEYEKRTGKKLEYHKSWDMLMPVVEQIESLGFEFNMTGKTNYTCISDDKNAFISSKKGKIGNVFSCVVEFVKWHKTL